MDDFVVLGDDLPTEAVVAQVDETLEALSLQRNEGKTKTYPPGRAGEALQDMLLAYIDPNGETTDRKMSEPELLDLLQAEAEADCPNPKRVRYVLRRLGEGSGVPALVSNPNLTNADPHFTCAYIARHGLRQQETREELVRLSWTPGDESAALRLHAALACARTSWGKEEGRIFLATATAKTERSAVRAHAWQAAARSPAWKASEVMEAADAERHPLVKRAAVLTLRRTPTGRTITSFLKKVEADPFVGYAAKWVRSAA